jgi:GNAT superfamily N-acetyltransferase
MSLVVRPIQPSETLRFIKSQWLFYKNEKHWVPPMLMDRKKLLDTKKNPFYQHSQVQCFLAERNGQIVGRIAAIINGNHNKTHRDKAGFFGFFDCINDQEVANGLFRAAEAWIRERGMDEMRGPVNPSMNDECGLLIDGHDGPPVMLMTYNPQYYAGLIEGAGYHKAQDLYAYLLRNENFASEKIPRLFDAIVKRYDLTFRSLNLKGGFKADVAAIKDMYNRAWEDNWGFVKFTDAEFDFLAADLKQVVNPEFVFFVESKGRPAGFCIALPDINQTLIHNRNGGTLGGVWHLLTKKSKIDLVRIVVLGVLPEFRGTGIDAALYMEIANRAKKQGILKGEASWILESNEMMNKGLTQTMNGERYRTYRIYSNKI